MGPEALAALHAAAMPGTRTWSAAEFATLTAAPGALLRCEGAAGFALARTGADEAELLMLAVAPAARRAGVARRLLAAIEADAAARGADVLLLEVAAGNAAARALYAAAGYAPRGRRRGYYRDAQGGREDALVLGKSLRPDAGTGPPGPRRAAGGGGGGAENG